MPRRNDISTILVVGAGPIVIGQACEFDYSGTQACKSLKAEGYRVVLVNSNPATIMTDPGLADRTYVEPITPSIVRRIIERERPEALLPTMGGQTSLNVAVELAEQGVLEDSGVELIGANLSAIRLAEDRELFKRTVASIGLRSAKSRTVTTYEAGQQVLEELGLPIIMRPAFTLGGSGGGIAHSEVEFAEKLRQGLAESPTSQVLLEENLHGWQEFELEVMRDLRDNVTIICSIENLNPMGVHTGDSITVAPAQTLSDSQYQDLRDQAIAVIRAVGVDCGGSNIQFAVHPETGDTVVIEMNPRVSRSSALASKATGFPIAKIAAKLAVGYSLDELPNEITRTTTAAFEPSIDYVVTKVPRFNFEKFPGTEVRLGTQMKSVGEVMAIGRTFSESFQKALRGLERNLLGFGPFALPPGLDRQHLLASLSTPSPDLVRQLWWGFELGMGVPELASATAISEWFLWHLARIHETHKSLSGRKDLSAEELRQLKAMGFSDRQLGVAHGHSVEAAFKMVDTCAGEFESHTPYYYSCYDSEDEVASSSRQKVIILGGGPNRIGQGIEFDYCCVHASQALQELGYESIMINSNPETVSTDFDTSDRLYFEPLTLEDVVAVYRRERPLGIIVQLGGQTPLNIAQALKDRGIEILGTQVEEIARAEDRHQFNRIVRDTGLSQPASDIAETPSEVLSKAAAVGFPLLVRPSYVLGGQSMQIIYTYDELEEWLQVMSESGSAWPVLLDEFLEDALEIDVDAIRDRHGKVLVAGILEHIERAGIHSGDSSCVLPPRSLSDEQVSELRVATERLAGELKVVGLINVQFAFRNGRLFVLEVNPRASRTVPFVAKATGIPWAKIATGIMMGESLERLRELGWLPDPVPAQRSVAVKGVVLPFKKFPGCQISLGPEMRSTGEVMGIDGSFALAFVRAQLAAGNDLLTSNKTVFLSVNDQEKAATVPLATALQGMGYTLYCTEGTFNYLKSRGLNTVHVRKAKEASPNVLNYLTDRRIGLLINIPKGKEAIRDNMSIRRLAILLDLPLITTLAAAAATVEALRAMRGDLDVRCLQEHHGLVPGA